MIKLNIIGAGLAGSEAAWQAASMGVEVNLYEMRDGKKTTPVHKTDKAAELVCSNSFRNDDVTSAIGLLHEELRLANSLIMEAADNNKLPAGSALAMDRDLFSEEIQQKLNSHPKINLIKEEITEIPNDGQWIIASGPLTSEKLTSQIINLTGKEQLAFFDAIAPVIYKDSIDFSICWFQSRYDKIGPGGNGRDYINCPLDKIQYYNFIDALIFGEKISFKEWEKSTPYFNGCLPIEVMAERGKDTLAYGPMKPVGLTNPHNQQRPFAVVQLRQDNKSATLYNIVGFQTKLKHNVQKEIFRQIPGLESAEFARLGGLHRNTFINSPKLLGNRLELKSRPHIRFAGQITGVEGYVESSAIGLLAGKFAASNIIGKNIDLPPQVTAIGSLLKYITGDAEVSSFQPMNINFGLMPELEIKTNKKDKGKIYSERAINAFKSWLNEN